MSIVALIAEAIAFGLDIVAVAPDGGLIYSRNPELRPPDGLLIELHHHRHELAEYLNTIDREEA